jgi:TonB family protein
MKKIFLITIFFLSVVCITAQEKEGIKMQSADEKGFIEVDKAPALVSQLKPVYPKEAKMQDIQGKVFLKLLIDEKGNVAKAKVEKSVNPLLDKSALNAAKKAKFSPAMLKDKPVKVWVILPVAYKLDAEKDLTVEEKWKANHGNSEYPAPDKYIEVEKMAEIISAGTPIYPEEAKRNKIEGKVFVKVLVDKEGTPKEAIVIKSDSEILSQPAKEAAMKSKFKPALNKGVPTDIWVVLPYRFKLDDNENK